MKRSYAYTNNNTFTYDKLSNMKDSIKSKIISGKQKEIFNLLGITANKKKEKRSNDFGTFKYKQKDPKLKLMTLEVNSLLKDKSPVSPSKFKCFNDSYLYHPPNKPMFNNYFNLNNTLSVKMNSQKSFLFGKNDNSFYSTKTSKRSESIGTTTGFTYRKK